VSTSIEDIPTIADAGRLGRRPGTGSAVADAYRPPVTPAAGLLGSLGIAKALELAGTVQRQLFPSSAQLAALHAAGPSYTFYNDCGGYNYAATCHEACFGFAPHHMDPWYCATCPEQANEPASNPAYNWHYVGTRATGIRYIDREPDVCNGRDAWKWKIDGRCGNCANFSVYRCHDGWKKYVDRPYWDPTICQGLVSCDGRLSLC
jgi:hypothetical protein